MRYKLNLTREEIKPKIGLQDSVILTITHSKDRTANVQFAYCVDVTKFRRKENFLLIPLPDLANIVEI